VPPNRWGDDLHEAKSILRETQAKVTTKAEKQANVYQASSEEGVHIPVASVTDVRPASGQGNSGQGNNRSWAADVARGCRAA
jgi:hypothetical protein